jgi:hypothetical protein
MYADRRTTKILKEMKVESKPFTKTTKKTKRQEVYEKILILTSFFLILTLTVLKPIRNKCHSPILIFKADMSFPSDL